MILDVNGVKFSYGKTDILHGVSLNLKPSEVLGILGPNGSGKTTMLRCINGILTPKQGSITLDAKEIKNLPRLEVAKSIGYVPQNSKTDICTPTVYEVVLMGRRPHVQWQFSKKDEELAWNAMEEMDVKHLATKSFDSLSSGQCQRVLMARALAQEANVLLLDEPTSNLDVRYQIEVMDTIHNIVHQKNLSACAVIHDLDLAMRFCDKVVVMNEGVIKSAGYIDEVLTPKLVKDVFGVDSVIENVYGRRRVIIT